MRVKVTTSLMAWNSKYRFYAREFHHNHCDFRDYQAKPELDRYEQEGIDDEGDHAELDYQQRREIERKMELEARQRAH